VRVVILGAGYSAIWCYRAVRRRLGNAAEITIVAPFEEHLFHGFTGEVLQGGLAPELLGSPLSECAPHAAQVRGWATAVDPEQRTVTVAWQGTERRIGYDELVVAIGARDRTDCVRGLGEHGWQLRFPGMLPRLLDHLAALDAAPAASAEEAQRRRTIVVVGGGFAGTETAAALGRRYRGTRTVVLVAATATVVPVWQDRRWLQKRLLRGLSAAGVTLLPDSRVAEVDQRGVRLADGTRIAAATVISAIGNTAPVLPGLEAHQGADGLLAVDDYLRVTDGVWSAGDAAAVRAPSGAAPKDAIWAIRAGTAVGRNVARAGRGRRPRRFGFRGLGSVASFAPGRAVARMYGVPLSGLLAWSVRATVFLWYVPSRRSAARIVTAAVGGTVAQRSAFRTAPLRVSREARPALPMPRPALFAVRGGAARPNPVAPVPQPKVGGAQQPKVAGAQQRKVAGG
jgi:NADH:ubiquinone reductase (H+-translocating)